MALFLAQSIEDALITPNFDVEIDPSHPLARDMTICLPFAGGKPTNLAFNPSYGQPAIAGSGVSIGATPSGVGLILPSGSGTPNIGLVFSNTTNADASWTVLGVGQIGTNNTYFGGENSSTGDWNLAFTNPNVRLEFTRSDGGNQQGFTSNISYTFGNRLGMAGSVGPRGYSVYGYDYASRYLATDAQSGAIASRIGSGAQLSVGQRSDGYSGAAQSVQVFYKWARQLGDDEIQTVFLDPYAMLRPVARRNFIFASSVTAGALSGTSASSATSTAALSGAGALSGTSSSAATSTASLTGKGALSSASASSATSTANISGTGALAGASASAATSSGTLKGSGALAGASASLAASTGNLSGIGALSGTTAGASTSTVTLTPSAALAGASNAASASAGTLTGTGTLAGASSAAATSAASLSGIGTLAGTSAASAVSTAFGVLLGALAGASASSAASSGTLSGTGHLSGQSASVATSVAALASPGQLSGTSAASSGSTGLLTVFGRSPLRAIFSIGQAIAAQALENLGPLFDIAPRVSAGVLGDMYTHYRPTSAASPVSAPNQIGNILAWITSDMQGKGNKPFAYNKPTAYALIDPTLIAVGDYLIGEFGTFFVASVDGVMPTQIVRCNQTVTVARPGSSNPGAGYYGGAPSTTLATLMTAWPASVLQGTKGEHGEVNLPGDTRLAWVAILLPATAGVEILPGDWITTTQATPMTYTVSACELTPLGWRLSAASAVA